jgi:hypothetical protein
MRINDIFDLILIHNDFSKNFLSDMTENRGIGIKPSHANGQIVREVVCWTGLSHINRCLKMSLTTAVAVRSAAFSSIAAGTSCLFD